MKHAREDYNRIQDPENKIPEDEPVFLLRGQDRFAPEVILYWADCVEEDGGSPEIVEAARNHVKAMFDWQELMNSKLPDMPSET